MLFSPGGHLFAHPLIQRTPVDQPVLKFPAGGIGGFHQNKKTLFLLFRHLDKRFDTIGSQIGIDRHKIFVKSVILFGSHVYFPRWPTA